MQPCSVAPCVLGSNITPTNPDVEVLAMLLKETPATDAGFGTLDRGNRGWVMTSFVLLGIGPPGFSSVPYTHGKKKNSEESKKLYEYDENGQTKFFSYEVGKTNKDRGARCHVAEIDGETHDVSVVLRPGMIVTEFMRPDKLSERVIVSQEEPCDVLPAFTLVWMQLGTGNIEQAAKGRLLKVKKIKTVPPNTLASCLYSTYNLPTTEEEFRTRNNVNTYKALRECLDSRSNCMMLNRSVSPQAYIVQELDSSEYVLVDMDGEYEMAHVDTSAMDMLLPSASLEQKIKFLNICIVSKAVTAVVRTRPADAVVLNGDAEKFRARVVAFAVNYNVFFGLDTVTSVFADMPATKAGQGMEKAIDKGEHFKLQLGSNFVLWTKQETWPGTGKTIYFKLELEDVVPSEVQADCDSWTFCDKGHASKHKLLKIAMLEDDFDEVFAAYENVNGAEEPPSVMSIEMRFENKNSASLLGKRPRPALELE